MNNDSCNTEMSMDILMSKSLSTFLSGMGAVMVSET